MRHITSFTIFNESQIEQLRWLFRQGKTIGEIVHSMRSAIVPEASFVLIVMKYMMRAFHLSLHEVIVIQKAPCMDGAAMSDLELDAILRPLIQERLVGIDDRSGGAGNASGSITDARPKST